MEEAIAKGKEEVRKQSHEIVQLQDALTKEKRWNKYGGRSATNSWPMKKLLIVRA